MEIVHIVGSHIIQKIINLFHPTLKSNKFDIPLIINWKIFIIFLKIRIEKHRKEKKLKEREKKIQELGNKKNLTNVRVVQRNLVYVTNLALSIAKEEVNINIYVHSFF